MNKISQKECDKVFEKDSCEIDIKHTTKQELVKNIKELSKINDVLRAEIANLRETVTDLCSKALKDGYVQVSKEDLSAVDQNVNLISRCIHDSLLDRVPYDVKQDYMLRSINFAEEAKRILRSYGSFGIKIAELKEHK